MLAIGLLTCLVGVSMGMSVGQAEDPLPVILWHGMGDSCCNPFSMGRIKRLIENNKPNIYVHSLMIGNNILEDMINGFLKPVNAQVEEACEKISKDPLLANGYNAIGFSQGSQFLRAVAQRCPTPRMNNLISIGGQQQGVYGFPQCPAEEVPFCDAFRRILNLGAYYPPIQNILVQAQYWHNAHNEEAYRRGSVFLADINQEREFNEDYKKNLMQLSNFVMVMFNNDTMVEPNLSQWFGFYRPGQGKEVLPLQETELYLKDYLGLQEMDKEGKLHFLQLDGDHLQMPNDWLIENIINRFL